MTIPSPFRTTTLVAEGVHLGGYAAHEWMHLQLPAWAIMWITIAVAFIAIKYGLSVALPFFCNALGQMMIYIGAKLMIIAGFPTVFEKIGKALSHKTADVLAKIVKYLRQ